MADVPNKELIKHAITLLEVDTVRQLISADQYKQDTPEHIHYVAQANELRTVTNWLRGIVGWTTE
jgi:hypothetical protein